MTDARALRRALLIAFGAGLALFLFVQPGNPYDEAEHLHAAWLMAVRGRHPLHDFFEHHTPLLWYVLEVPFRLGIRGPEVLYAARVLVILCAAIWAFALVRLARQWSGAAAQEKPGAFAFLLFALTILLAQQLFVTRPETLAAALTGLALVCWLSPSLAGAAGGGALLGLSFCASPRFALLAPAFLLVAAPSARRIAVACAAGCAALVAFVVWLCPWPELVFDLRFSSLLQHVGIAPTVFSLVFLGSCVLAASLIWGMLIATRRVPRRAAALWAVHGVLIWTLCAFTAGRFLYAQAFAPALLWATLFTAWLEAQPAVEGVSAASPALLTAALLGSLALLAMQTAAASLHAYNVPSLTASRRLLLDALPPGARVILLPDYHPITVDDATYWGTALSSGICDAAEEFPKLYPRSAIRPGACDFLLDVRRRRPEAVSRELFIAAPPLQIAELRAELDTHYQLTDLLDDAPLREFSANTLFRKP